MTTPVQKRFLAFIIERDRVRLLKEAGKPQPWTDDPILGPFKFCNVNREHDTVTRWIAKHVRPKLRKLPIEEAVFQLYVARVFNDPDVLEVIMPDGLVDSIVEMVEALRRRKKAGLRILRGAYLVVPHGTAMAVEDFYADVAARVRFADFDGHNSLTGIADVLQSLGSIGDFMANQVCTDLRYTPGHDKWVDWETFVLAGPGTRRGLARYNASQGAPRRANGRILGASGDCGPTLRAIRATLLGQKLPAPIASALKDINNLSNCFCEFDKYERARDGKASLRRYTHGN